MNNKKLNPLEMAHNMYGGFFTLYMTHEDAIQCVIVSCDVFIDRINSLLNSFNKDLSTRLLLILRDELDYWNAVSVHAHGIAKVPDISGN